MLVTRAFWALSVLTCTAILWIQPQIARAQIDEVASVRNLRYQTIGDSTRIVIEIDGDVEFRGERIGNPDRIFFDISGAKLSSDFGNRNVIVENEILKRIRVAQNRPDVVRVVFDVSKVSEYSISGPQGTGRMVVELYGPMTTASKPARQTPVPSRQNIEIKEDTPITPPVEHATGAHFAERREPEAVPEAESEQVPDIKEQKHDAAEFPEPGSEGIRAGPASVQNVRYIAGVDATQIVIAIDGDIEYRGERISNPDRIFFDLSGAKLGSDFGDRTVVIDNELLKRIRVAQNRPDVVRVVLDVCEVDQYTVSEVQGSAGMIVELLGPAGTTRKTALQTSVTGRQDTEIKEDTWSSPLPGPLAGDEVAPPPETVESNEVEAVQITDIKEQKQTGIDISEENSGNVRTGPAWVQNVRYHNGADSTRIVIEIDGDIEFRGERISNPDRIFFDISDAKLAPGFRNQSVIVENELLKRIRVAQNRPDVVRVVFDVSEVSEYSVSGPRGPNRMIVDLYGPPGMASKPQLQASGAGRQDTEKKADTATIPVAELAGGLEMESAPGSRGDKDAEPVQTAVWVENPLPSVDGGPSPADGAQKLSSSTALTLNASQLPAENKKVLPPKPVSNSIVPASSGFSFMNAKPFTVGGVLTTGYYSSYTRGGSNDAQTIHYVPASAKFDINGFFLTPDLFSYSFQPELNASPQASDAGFQGGNGLRMRIDTLRRQPMLMTFRYANVRLEDAYFGSLSQLSSYTLNNRNKELGITTQLRLPGLPTTTMDWGTNSILSQSYIPEIPEYVSRSDHRNIDMNYQKWGWDFRGFANRQQQTSNLYSPGAQDADASILHQKLKQYRGSVRWNSIRDLELSLDAGSQATSNFLLNRPIALTSQFGNANLRLFQRRRWKTSLRAGYTSNISDLLLNSLIGELNAAGSIAPDESILLPMQRTTSSLNLGGYTSVDLSHGVSTYASIDRTEVSPAGNRELRSRNFTATAGMAYSKVFGWGSLSGQYGRSYGNGSVTGQRGRIDGQSYAVTVQPGRWEALQIDFSLRGTDQRIVNELPVHNKTFVLEGNMGFRVYGGLRSRIGGGWQKSSLTNADARFLTEGYSARAALEHRRFQISGSLNSVLGSPLQAYEQVYSGIGIDPTLLSPLQIAPSVFRGFTLSAYVVPIRRLELSALYTRSLQRRDGVFGNDFETIDAAAKFNFRNLKFEAGYFSSGQVYTNNQIINPETERGRFYFRISRTFKF